MSDLRTIASTNGARIMKDCTHVNTTTGFEMTPEVNRPADRPDYLPRLSRNSWDRPDLARLMGTETDYAPYITPANTNRRQPGS